MFFLNLKKKTKKNNNQTRTTSDAGSRNQMIPSKMLDTKNELGTKTSSRIRCVHAYCRNW